MVITEKIKEILTGWKNLALNKNKPQGEQRMSICSTCSLNVNGICSTNKSGKAVKNFTYNSNRGDELRIQGKKYNGCGCPLKAKTVSPDSKCPIGKW